MDLYHKKANIGSKLNRNKQGIYRETDYNPSKKMQNLYIQKMIPRNESLVSGGETIPNVRSSMQDIFSNDDNKKKAIKYVINIGKNKTFGNSPRNEGPRRFEKSVSPNRGKFPQGYGNSYDNQNIRYPGRRGESQRNNRLTNLSDSAPIDPIDYNNLKKKSKNKDNPPSKKKLSPKIKKL